MFFPRQLTLLASLGLWIFRATAEKTGYIPLNITALSSRNGYSVLECWQLASIPVDAMAAANYAIGETTVATWSRIEPRTTVGEAWAPKVQLSIILNGLIRITSPAPAPAVKGTYDNSSSAASMPLPDHMAMSGQGQQGGAAASVVVDEGNMKKRPDTKVGYIMPGTLKSSVVIAADLKSVSTLAGHYTEFPSDEPTVLVQIPFDGNKAPEHTVLYDGPCV